MSVLIFVDQAEGHVKKGSLEALTYGAKIAQLTGTMAEGIVLGSVTEDLTALGKYGVKKIHHVNNDVLNHFDAQVYTNVIAQAADAMGSKVIVFSNNLDGKAIAPRLSVRLKAGLVSGAVELPETNNGFVVKKNVFSGKAFAHGSTYGGNPLACHIAILALKLLKEENMAENSLVLGEVLRKELTAIQSKHIGTIRGKGLLNAIVIHHSGSDAAWRLCLELKENGLLAKPTHGDKIRFAPPLIIGKEQLLDCVAIIKKSLSCLN